MKRTIIHPMDLIPGNLYKIEYFYANSFYHDKICFILEKDINTLYKNLEPILKILINGEIVDLFPGDYTFYEVT